jgi:hypothetical protein
VLDELEGTSEFVLAPACGPAPDSTPVTEDVIELIVTGWETDGVRVLVPQVNDLGCDHYSDVIAETFGIKLRMPNYLGHRIFDVLIFLWTVEAASVVFTDTNLHSIVGSNLLQVVRCSQDLSGASVKVVVEVLRHEGAGTEEVVVLVKK